MPPIRDITMIKVDTLRFAIALGKAELEPKELAEKAGISVNIVYSMRRGCLTKPRYVGACCRVMGVKIEDVIALPKEEKVAESIV